MSRGAISYMVAWVVALVALVVARRRATIDNAVVGAAAGVVIVLAGAYATYSPAARGALAKAAAMFVPFAAMGAMSLSPVLGRLRGGSPPVSGDAWVDGAGRLDVEAALTGWLDAVAESNTLPLGCQAVIVGFFADGPEYRGYVCGTDGYDLSDPDWAVDPRFRFQPPFVDRQSRRTIDMRQYQARVIEVVTRIVGQGANGLLSQAPHVAVGFDELELDHVR